MELISIIVPIYNVELYLKKCVESLLSQTYSNIQIVLVDDGSTDTSGSIADFYAQKYSNVVVYHKKNGGLSDARNYGISMARGKYICFLDSDDWVHEKMIETLYKNLIENDADISEAQYIRVNNEEPLVPEIEEKIYVFNNYEASRNLRNYYLNQIVVWNKLYKRECFTDIKFPVGKIHEDEFTTYKLLYNSNKIVVTTNVLFFYRNTPNSIINKAFSKRRLDILEAYDEAIYFYVSKKEKKLLKMTVVAYLYILLKYKEECVGCDNMKEINQILYDKFLSVYKGNWKSLVFNKTGIKLLIYLIRW